MSKRSARGLHPPQEANMLLQHRGEGTDADAILMVRTASDETAGARLSMDDGGSVRRKSADASSAKVRATLVAQSASMKTRLLLLIVALPFAAHAASRNVEIIRDDWGIAHVYGK